MTCPCADLAELQSLSHEIMLASHLHSHLASSIRQRRVPSEASLIRVATLHSYISRIPNALFSVASPPDTEWGSENRRPLSYAQTMTISKIIHDLNDEIIHELADTFISSVSLSEGIVTSAVRFVMDGVLSKRNSVFKFLQRIIESTPPQDLLKPSGIVSSILRHVLDRFGGDFLVVALKPTIIHVLGNDSLDLEFAVGSDSPRTPESQQQRFKDLFSICESCLERIIHVLPSVPLEIRWVASRLFSRGSNEEEGLGLASDYIFLHWIVNAFWAPGELADIYPLSNSPRSNLEAVGTVMLKLLSGSLFSSHEEKLVSINEFILIWNPRVRAAVRELISNTNSLPSTTPIRVKSSWNPVVVCTNDIYGFVKLSVQNPVLSPLVESLQTIPVGSLPQFAIIDLDFPDVSLPVPFVSRSKNSPEAMFVSALSNASYFGDSCIHHDLSMCEVLQLEVQSLMGVYPSRAAMLAEAIELIKVSEDPTSFTDHCKEELLKDLSSHVQWNDTMKAMIREQLLMRDLEALRGKELKLVESFRTSRSREVLDALGPRVRYFDGQLRLRLTKMNKYDCSGFTNHEQDVFVCRRCRVVSDKQSQALDVAFNDCVRVLQENQEHLLSSLSSEHFNRAFSLLGASQKADFDISGQAMRNDIWQFIVTYSFDSVFIYCRRQESMFRTRLRELNAEFSSYRDFQLYLDSSLDLSRSNADESRAIHITETSLSMAVAGLRRIGSYRTLGEKMDCIQACRDMLISVLSMRYDASADDYIPLV